CFFFFSSRRRHTRFSRDWSSDVCSSDLGNLPGVFCRYNIISQHETRIGVQVVNELIVQGAPSAQNEIGGFPAPAITRRAVLGREIGRASCRERVEIAVVAVALYKKR